MRAGVLLGVFLGFAGHVSAQLTIDLALTSDYMWRGYTQNDGDPSASIGATYTTDPGFYANLWTANVTDELGIEVDGILGYAGETESGFTWDMGYVYYKYTDDPADYDPNFGEIFVGGGYKWFSLTGYVDPENDNEYLSADLEIPIGELWTVALHGGTYSIDEGGDSTDYEAKVTRTWKRFSFSGAYTKLDLDEGGDDEDTLYATVGWSWSSSE